MKFLKSPIGSLFFFAFLGGALMLYLTKSISASADVHGDTALLLVGKDDTGDSSRADSLILMVSDQRAGQLLLLSIPRDSKVYIPCNTEKRPDKIAHSYPFGQTNWQNNGGGFACVSQTVEDLLGLPVYTLEIEQKNWAFLIGKAEVTITASATFCQDQICFKKGQEVLLGADAALAYLRHRATFSDGDLTRVQNQRQVLAALLKTFQGMNSLEKSRLASHLIGKVKTNYPKLKLMDLITLFDQLTIKSATLKGKWDGNTYYVVDSQEITAYRKYFKQLFGS